MGKSVVAVANQEGIKRQIDALLEPGAEGRWPTLLRELWVGDLDFQSAQGELAVGLGEAQITIMRVAERDGITVFGSVLPRAGYVRAAGVLQVIKDLKRTVEGDFVLCVSSGDGGEWQFAWSTSEGGRQVVKLAEYLVVSKGGAVAGRRRLAQAYGGKIERADLLELSAEFKARRFEKQTFNSTFRARSAPAPMERNAHLCEPTGLRRQMKACSR